MDNLVIRGGRIFDGTGDPAFDGDVAVRDGFIRQVGGTAGRGRREIDADGCIVTPGFVDIHTHYDGQINWDPYLSSSSWNGVTSVVMGNCGIGFAPARPADRSSLIALMSAIEEVSSASLEAGIDWDWETFPEYLDALARRTLAIDVGTQIPHASVRAYVMGERGVNNELASPTELGEMAAVVTEAMQAGALGLTGAHTPIFRTAEGNDTPGYRLPFEEMLTLCRAAGAAGKRGVIGMNTNFDDIDKEFAWLREMNRVSGLPVFFLYSQQHFQPQKFPLLMRKLEESAARGEPVFGQYAGRPIANLLGLMSSRNPFWERPSYKAIAALPLDERVARLREPAFRAQLMAEQADYRNAQTRNIAENFEHMFRLGDPPDYEPPPERSIAALARAKGVAPEEMALDIMLERDGRELMLVPVTNYLSGDASVCWDLLHHPQTVLGLADGGAHATLICDSSYATTMLAHWARDRSRGPRLSLETAVRKVSLDGARFYGLADRGALAVGMKADLNIIDFERLRLRAPEMAFDQPAGGYRLVQRSEGYVATIVAGVPIFENGIATGEMPGRLIRSKPKAA